MNQRSANRATASLATRLRDAIRERGPISFRDWMEAALYDERDGYYSRADLNRWGPFGDYRTSPERSPLFAATFARYFAELYRKLGSPEQFTIYEAGAGAGYFARGVLDALEREHRHLYRALRYVIDEKSRASRRRIAVLLGQHSNHNHRVEFVPDAARRIPIESGVVFANELLDAFPVHRVRMTGGRLCEQFVDVDRAGAFTWVAQRPSDTRLAETLRQLGAVLREGQQAEINLAAEDWLKKIAGMLASGFVVTVDYGAESQALYDPALRFGGTLRSIRQHALTENVLDGPGEQDITSHVNWTQLIEAGVEANLKAVEFKRQDQFLLDAGILDQLESLASNAASQADVVALRLGARELMMPDRMGASFQVLVQEKRRVSEP